MITILLATFLVSAIAFLTALGLSTFPKFLKKSTIYLVALAAGTLLGAAFFDLIPESLEFMPPRLAFTLMLASFVSFFAIEKLLHWHHCHDEDCDNKSIRYINLIGDALHNFIDGAIIAVTFQVNPALGVGTTLAIALHEFPQEIGDFGVLIHNGMSRKNALLANALVAAAAMIGGIAGFILTETVMSLSHYLLPVAAGTFLYLATVDLIPEFRKHTSQVVSFALLAIFAFGLAFLPIFEMTTGLGHSHETEDIHLDESIKNHIE